MGLLRRGRRLARQKATHVLLITSLFFLLQQSLWSPARSSFRSPSHATLAPLPRIHSRPPPVTMFLHHVFEVKRGKNHNSPILSKPSIFTLSLTLSRSLVSPQSITTTFPSSVTILLTLLRPSSPSTTKTSVSPPLPPLASRPRSSPTPPLLSPIAPGLRSCCDLPSSLY